MSENYYAETVKEIAFDVVRLLTERQRPDEQTLDAALTAYVTLAANRIGIANTIDALRRTADAIARQAGN